MERHRGQYSFGIGIDQESAIFISAETNGQPKFPCTTRYFRLGDRIEAACTHQGYTFLEFRGTVSGEEAVDGSDVVHDEWWTKYSRAIGGTEGCLLYTSPSPRDKRQSRMPSSA